MLLGYPTKSGTGISIFGDYGDLSNLYDTVHHITNSLDESYVHLHGQVQILLNLAYEIRKAFSGERLTEKVTFEGNGHKFDYYGFQCVWTDMLVYTATLRYNAGFIQTDKLQQSCLYMLEHVVEKALFEYDSEGASEIRHYIGRGINITNQHSFIIYQTVHIAFVTDKSGKKRFRNIPKLLDDYFSESSAEYKRLIHTIESIAKSQNRHVQDVTISAFPEIKW